MTFDTITHDVPHSLHADEQGQLKKKHVKLQLDPNRKKFSWMKSRSLFRLSSTYITSGLVISVRNGNN